MSPDASAFTVASAVCAAVTDMMRMCCGAVAFNGNLSECGNDGAAAWANDGALNIRSADSRGGNWWQLASGLLSWTASYPPGNSQWAGSAGRQRVATCIGLAQLNGRECQRVATRIGLAQLNGR